MVAKKKFVVEVEYDAAHLDEILESTTTSDEAYIKSAVASLLEQLPSRRGIISWKIID